MQTDLGRCFSNRLEMIGHIECPVLVPLDGFCIAVEYSLVDSIDSSSLHSSLQLNFIALPANNKIVLTQSSRLDHRLKQAIMSRGVAIKSYAGKIKFFSNLYRNHLHQTSKVFGSIVYTVKYRQVK